MSSGIVYLVGAGPGHPDLITVRGRDVLSRAQVVVYDRLTPHRLLNYAPQNAELIYAGKRPGDHRLSQEEINETLVDRARKGRCVVRLKGGDPFVFGRGGEEAMALEEADVDFEVVPGLTAGLAVPAWAGIPATHRNVSSAAGLVTGHHAADTDESPLDWRALADWRGTLSFYMGVSKLDQICERLIEHGKDEQTPAAMIQWGTTPRQRTVQGTLETITARARKEGIEPPAILIVGPVVNLRDGIAWYEAKPLFGRAIVVTRPREQGLRTASALEELGAEAIMMPTIRVTPPADPAPLRSVLNGVDGYDWIILTSTNGVEHFFRFLNESGRDARVLAGVRICAIGSATAENLRAHGIRADMVPDRFTTRGILNAFEQMVDVASLKILCPRSDIAPPDLVDGLSAMGARVDEVEAYGVVPDRSGAARVADMLEDDELSWLTFTSSSTVSNFFAEIGHEVVERASVRIASIGPRTSDALREEGFAADVEASPHTTDALIEAIVEAECRPL